MHRKISRGQKTQDPSIENQVQPNSKIQTPDMAKKLFDQENNKIPRVDAPNIFPNDKLQDASIEKKSQEKSKTPISGYGKKTC